MCEEECFKVEKGYGLVVDIQNQTLRYFKDGNPGRIFHWPNGDNKISLSFAIIEIRTLTELKHFMFLIKIMFGFDQRMRIINVELENKNLIGCCFK